jgi:AraC family transcriptional regulator
LAASNPSPEFSSQPEWLYGSWLPQSGREPGDAPCLEEYLNSPRDTAPTELLSDIYLPLR